MSEFTKSETRPVYFWPENTNLDATKRVVMEMNLPFKVVPYWFKPGEHARCIALEEGFPYLTDHAYPKSPESIKAAVQWFFGLLDLPQAKTTLSKLQSVFGDDTREVWDWPSQD